MESSFIEASDRNYFKFPPKIAPYLAGIFPLLRKDNVPEKALELHKLLVLEGIYSFYDSAGSIGKRYARADEIGIPFCITADYDTIKDNTFTLRNRDTKEQIRLEMSEIAAYLRQQR